MEQSQTPPPEPNGASNPVAPLHVATPDKPKLEDLLLPDERQDGERRQLVLQEYLMTLRATNEALTMARGILQQENTTKNKLQRIALISSLVKEKLATLKAISTYQELMLSKKKEAKRDEKEGKKPVPMPQSPSSGSGAPSGSARGGLQGTFSGKRPEE